VLTVRILDEDVFAFELQSSTFSKKIFRCSSEAQCEEWVSAIRSAVKHSTGSGEEKKPAKRRMSLSAAFQSGFIDQDKEDAAEHADAVDVNVLVVSLRSVVMKTELVLTRTPSWKRLIRVPKMNRGDELVIMLSNGGTVTLSLDTLLYRADIGAEFEAPIQNALLATSLKIRAFIEEVSVDSSSSSAKQKQSNAFFGGLGALLRLCEANGNTTTLFILVLIVILMSTRSVVSFLCSSGHFTVSTGVLLLFSLSLAMGTARELAYTRLQPVPGGASEMASGSGAPSTICLVLMEHQYISPDAPVKEPEEEIPQRYIIGCDGDLREARRRWDLTRKFREEERVDEVLNEEQPHFFTIKTLWPHYVSGRGREGHPLWLERPGDIEIEQLGARGITPTVMLRHWLFITEYLWKYIGGVVSSLSKN
jgi:hypothetical protein